VQIPRRVEKETSPILPSTSDTGDDIYVEKSKNFEIEGDDDDEGDIKENVKCFGRTHFGEIAIPFLCPYLYNKQLLDTHTLCGEMVIIL